MKIPLFDIDWTLLVGQPKVHLDAFDAAIKKHCAVEANMREILRQGMIDNQIIIDALKKHHIPLQEIKKKLPKITQSMVEYFLSHEDEAEYIPMPGAKELLSTLKKANIPRGVLSGNVEEIAWRKLEKAGLRSLIDFGAFGNWALRRVDLIPLALEKAMEIAPKTTPEDLVIIGDSPLEMESAREAEIPAIGVSAGLYKAHELKAAGANQVVPSLSKQKEILQYLDS